MYSQPLAATPGAAVAGGLAFTGLNVVWAVVLGLTLMGAGIVLTRIAPRRKKRLA